MYKYGGIIVHQEHDDYGPVEVIENGYQRALHFGSEAKQSCMDLQDPFYLSLSYTRAMLSALLFHPAPRRVLLIGLGGGSLAKFIWQHFPECRLDVVENRTLVHSVAQRYFKLPDDDRINIHITDAAEFIHHADSEHSAYDLILLDAFTADGVAPSTTSMMFFAACRASLAADGVMAANLRAEDAYKLEDILGALADTFDGRLLRLPIDGKANIITLAISQGKPRKELRQLDARAKQLQQQLDLEFISLLKTLRKHNRYWGYI